MMLRYVIAPVRVKAIIDLTLPGGRYKGLGFLVGGSLASMVGGSLAIIVLSITVDVI